MKQSNR